MTGDTQNRHNVTAAGTQTWGSGSATPDTTAGRSAAAVWYSSKTALIGSATALGDNGVGELQLADATTAPTTSPAGGSVIYSQSAAAVPRVVGPAIEGLPSDEEGFILGYRTGKYAESKGMKVKKFVHWELGKE